MFYRFLGILITVIFAFRSANLVYAGETSDINLKKTDFIEIQEAIPSIVLEIKYATTDNFAHTKLYENSKAFLRKGTADKLKKVADEVAEKGFRLKIWDAYRDPEVQFKMWNLVPDSRYVANPYKGYSNHSRGSAIDLTLVDRNGQEVSMSTPYDDFTPAAARTNKNGNSAYLEKVMVKHGFKPLVTEWWHYDDSESYPPAKLLLSSPVSISLDKETITISAIGDITLGQDERFPYEGSFNHFYNLYGIKYFFAGVKNILKADDLTIANLEGTLTEASQKPDKTHQGNQAFYFKGSPSYTSILNDGSVEAVNLANNHSMDFLEPGLLDTAAALNDANILNFGYKNSAIYEINGVKIGLIGVNTFGPLEEGIDINVLKLELAKTIKELKDRTSLVIVSMHWGIEKSTSVTQAQQDLGRYAIDLGADLVLGHHPHVIQPYEVYKGKTIVYSLGNFVFGGNSNPQYKETLIFQQKFDFDQGNLVTIHSPQIIPCSLNSRYKPEPLPLVQHLFASAGATCGG